jgi:hypothetical protein
MSKWNVMTVDGRVKDVAAVKAPPPPKATLASPSDLEASNPMFKYGEKSPSFHAASGAGAGEKIVGSEGCMHKCGRCLDTRRGKVAVGCAIFSIVVFAILIAILFPRFPTVDIDKNATIDNTKVGLARSPCQSA